MDTVTEIRSSHLIGGGLPWVGCPCQPSGRGPLLVYEECWVLKSQRVLVAARHIESNLRIWYRGSYAHTRPLSITEMRSKMEPLWEKEAEVMACWFGRLWLVLGEVLAGNVSGASACGALSVIAREMSYQSEDTHTQVCTSLHRQTSIAGISLWQARCHFSGPLR